MQRRSDPHVRALNVLVDELCGQDGRGIVPYVAPDYGGVDAELLCLFQSPATTAVRSGFLCRENDDDTAEHFAILLDRAGIGAERVVTWNVYPWCLDRAPTAAEITAGLPPLHRVLGVLPHLKVVMLMGCAAWGAWERYERLHPECFAEGPLRSC